jgi:hypothetical protein
MAAVRLRSRIRRSTEATRPPDPFERWTVVGNRDSPVQVQVDPAGRLHVPGHGWLLDWWIGAEDRWHRPAQEAAVRQQLIGSSPVVETRVRIPSGDAVARTYGARGPHGGDLVVVEIENDSRVPVALALVVEAGPGRALRDLALRGSEVHLDGTTMWLPRSPGRMALSTDADARPAAEVALAGDAEPVRAESVTCDAGRAQGVLLFPLAHTAALRVAISLDAGDRAPDLGQLPSAQQVASGWGSHSDQGPRIEVPDRRLREAIAASTRFLLLGAAEPDPSLAEVAARWRFTGVRPDGGAVRVASLVERAAPDPSREDRVALPSIAELLDAMGERRGAEDVRAIARSLASSGATSDPYDLLSSAGSTWTWSTARGGCDLAVNAALLLATRAVLVADTGADVALSPLVPDGWLGLGWEVHDLPTAAGRLSFAIRWHGDRPALLWDLEPQPDAGPVRLTAPALDPAWSTTERRGDALLAPVPVPERPRERRGLSIPVTIDPTRRGP